MRVAARVRTVDASTLSIVANAASLVGTTAVTSGFGFFFWWLAARQFSPAAVGLAASAVSAMTLLGAAAGLGLGTVLQGELPRERARAPSLIATSLMVVGPIGCLLGASFALVAPAVSPEFGPFVGTAGGVLLLGVGVGLTAVALTLDQALIGLLRGDVPLLRNALFAGAKLGLLLALAVLWPGGARTSLHIFAAWVAGLVCSLFGAALLSGLRGQPAGAFLPRARALSGLGWRALSHHSLNLALQAPGLALPVLVTALLSAASAGYFYTAWMVTGLAFAGPIALATVLYPVGAGAPARLAERARLTLKLSLVAGTLGCAGLLVGADWILSCFGRAYAGEAASCLRIVGLAALPLVVKDHYVTIGRISERTAQTARAVAAGGALELALAAAGARVGGLPGLGAGWLLAVCVEALFMSRTVYEVAVGWRPTAEPGARRAAG